MKNIILGSVQSNHFFLKSKQSSVKIITLVFLTLFSISAFSQAVIYVDAFNVGSQITQPSNMVFNNDGTKMFIIGNGGGTNNYVYEYTLSTGFDVSTASFVDGVLFSFGLYSSDAMAFNNDGTTLFTSGSTTSINVNSFSTPFDISTFTSTTNVSFAGEIIYLSGLTFNSDGTKFI